MTARNENENVARAKNRNQFHNMETKPTTSCPFTSLSNAFACETVDRITYAYYVFASYYYYNDYDDDSLVPDTLVKTTRGTDYCCLPQNCATFATLVAGKVEAVQQ